MVYIPNTETAMKDIADLSCELHRQGATFEVHFDATKDAWVFTIRGA